MDSTWSSRRMTRSATRAEAQVQPSPLTPESIDMNPWNGELFSSSLLSSSPTCLNTNNAKPVNSSPLSLPPASLNLYDTESDHSSPANLPSASLLHNAEPDYLSVSSLPPTSSLLSTSPHDNAESDHLFGSSLPPTSSLLLNQPATSSLPPLPTASMNTKPSTSATSMMVKLQYNTKAGAALAQAITGRPAHPSVPFLGATENSVLQGRPAHPSVPLLGAAENSVLQGRPAHSPVPLLGAAENYVLKGATGNGQPFLNNAEISAPTSAASYVPQRKIPFSNNIILPVPEGPADNTQGKIPFLANAEISTQIAAPTESSAPEEAAGNFRQRKKRHDPNNAAHLFLDEDDSVSIGSELGAKRQKLRDIDGDFVSGGRYTSPSSDIIEPVFSTDKSMGKRPRGRPSYDKSSKVTVAKVKRSKEAKPKIEVYYVNAQDGKPEPHGQPPVWGDKRQQICETLPYYNAYQGGAYRSEGVLYGFLTDKEVGPRDQFTDQILITSCGGGRTKDEKTGKMVQTADQSNASIGQAFLRTMKENLPVAVIAGQGNSISPSRLPHPYNVLDWFHITDVWFEKEGTAITAMARFEKINLDEISWWAPKDHVLSQPNFLSPRADVQVCKSCHQPSKVIYSQGFTCLQTQCTVFFKFEHPVNLGGLSYNEDFLAERTGYVGNPPGPISPALLTEDDAMKLGILGYEAKCKQGFVCPQCRCCGRRIDWLKWICENPGCNFVYSVKQHILSVAEAIEQSEDSESLKRRKAVPLELVSDTILVAYKVFGRYNITEYVLPGENDEPIGFVRIFKADEVINAQPDGPDDLFRQMQEHDFGLKRRPVRTPGSIAEVVTDHWSVNTGAPYKYAVAQDSKSFEESEPVVLKAVMRLIWAGKQAVDDRFEQYMPFNEMLTIGYFENTHMGDHDDGETTLGPTVATLSLGAGSTMTFRPKAKSDIGTFRGGKKTANKTQKKPIVLSIKLSHGDIVVMHGRGIQKHYLHSVIPHGKLRFALTCRYVDPEKMETEQEREYTRRAGILPASAEAYAYDGDQRAKPIVRTVDTMTLLGNHIDANVQTGNYRREELLGALEELQKTWLARCRSE